MERKIKKERLGWYFYDWANSAFPTTVITVFLGPYLTSIANAVADKNGMLSIFGIDISSGAYFPYLVSISVLLQVIILPLIGGLVDKTNMKKLILGITAYIGAFSTLALFFLEGERILFGGLMFLVANIAFGSSAVVYNSILNDIADISERDSVSSKGWAFGYIGGGLLLLLNLIFYSKAESFGVSGGFAVRICLASAGAWWAVFTIPTLMWVRNYKSSSQARANFAKVLKSGFGQLFITLKSIRKYPKTLFFLLAYLMYNDGVQAVITLAAQFGQEEIGLEISFLTTVILIVQFVAFFGSLAFGYLADKIGSKNSLIVSLVIWIAAVAYAFLYLYGESEFMILGIAIGFVLGGTQALSRSLFSKMIPKGREAEYFSLYELSERGTSWLAPLIFGVVYQFSGSYRYAILSLLLFFAIGLVMLLFAKVEEAISEANKPDSL